MANDRVTPPKRASRSRRVFLVGGIVVTVMVVGLLGYAFYLRQMVAGNVAQADLLPSATQAADEPVDPSLSPASSPPVKLPNTGMNFLIVSSDSNAMEGGQADVIVLAHVSEARDRISLISFPRDLYVSVPGEGQTKISTAYATGGSKLLVTTVQNLLGVVVDHAAVTTFEGMARMTDALGGVDVAVTESSTANGYTFKPGTTRMDGKMALAYVAEREHPSSGDTTQSQRQQAFVRALMLKSLSPATLSNPLQLARFIDAASKSFTVDNGLGADQMSTLALGLFSVRADDISFLTAPTTGSATRPPSGVVKLIDVPKTRALGDAVRTDQMQEYKP